MQPLPKYARDELSSDALFEGKVVLYQPVKGYRFSVDAPLLTWFACPPKTATNCADLGSGCGVIAIGLLAAQKAKRVVAVEIQPKLAALSTENARANNVENHFEIINGSITTPHPSLKEKQFDLIVSNPPFWPCDTGRLPPDEERRIARHEISITLRDLIHTAKHLLHPKKGRFCIAFPALRLETLLCTIAESGLNTTRATFVHPHQNSEAELVLLEARCGRSGQLKITPPLILRNTDGTNSDQANHILSGKFSPALQTKQDIRIAVPN